jgi:hypothetical protein
MFFQFSFLDTPSSRFYRPERRPRDAAVSGAVVVYLYAHSVLIDCYFASMLRLEL